MRLWDTATGNALATFLGHKSAAACVAFAPDGKALASASFDGTVRLWDPAAPPGPALLASDPGGFFGPPVALAPDGKTLIAARNNAIHFWDLASGKERGALKQAPEVNLRRARGGENKVIDDLVLCPDGKRLAVRRGFEVEVWDLTAMRPLSKFRLNRSRSTHLCFAADGHTLIVGGKLWDVDTGKEASARFPAALADAVAFSPNGELVVTAGEFRQGSRRMTVSDAASGVERYTLPAANSFVTFSPDSGTMAAPLADGSMGLWDVARGRQQTALRGHSYGVAAAAFSPDGRTIATAGNDRSVRLWDPVTGQERLSLRLENRRPGGIAFSTDGQTLVVNWGGPPENPLDPGVLALYRATRHRNTPLWQSE